MPNPYFQFKQFTVYQDKSALKVCTDACILGAWFAEKAPRYSLVLDIGSGTGLLMLLLAQKHKGEIHGIELDLDSFRQARENLACSKWKERLSVYPGDARSYIFRDKYDFIITNPPFFEGDLAPVSEKDDMAKHSRTLTLADLLTVITRNLQPAGSFGILLPFHRLEYFEELAQQRGFFLSEKLLVRQTPTHDPFRAVLHFIRRRESHVPESLLTIKDADNQYTPEFVELMRDYYLYL